MHTDRLKVIGRMQKVSAAGDGQRYPASDVSALFAKFSGLW
jgi:hypothetical protein